jgi:hypothetical protein
MNICNVKELHRKEASKVNSKPHLRRGEKKKSDNNNTRRQHYTSIDKAAARNKLLPCELPEDDQVWQSSLPEESIK